MNKNCAFTICTRSYIGLAKVMRDSFLKYNDQFDFYIFVVDFTDDISENDVVDVRKISILSENKYLELAYKYNVTEFCTALKPFCFDYLLQRYDAHILYFDPDLLFFSKFSVIENQTKSIYLTPHRVCMNDTDCDISYERDILQSGLYNCGFVGLYNTEVSKKIVKWWELRLLDYCFFDPHRGLFTDQKWIDYIPCLVPLEELYIIRDLGYNFAPWNFYERRCIGKGGDFFIEGRKGLESEKYQLCFAHFSGYNYKKVVAGDFTHKTTKNVNYSDVELILKIYQKALQNNDLDKYFFLPYLYNTYENGEVITQLQRRLYVSFADSVSVKNPFSVDNNSYYSLLKRNKMLIREKEYKEQNTNNITGFEAKKKIVEKSFKLFKFFFGVKMFNMLLKVFDYYGDNQKHSYLIKK